MVEWVLLAVLSAVVGFPVTKIMEHVWNRWRNRNQRAPLTMAQVQRHHARHFWMAVVTAVIEAACAVALLLGALTSGSSGLAAFGVLAAIAAVLLLRSARRRWKRWQESKLAPS